MTTIHYGDYTLKDGDDGRWTGTAPGRPPVEAPTLWEAMHATRSTPRLALVQDKEDER